MRQELHTVTHTSNKRFTVAKVEVPELNNADCFVITARGWHAIGLLKYLLQRACNTWDDASPDIKELHDLVVHGKVLQQYNFDTKIRALESQGNMIPPATGKVG